MYMILSIFDKFQNRTPRLILWKGAHRYYLIGKEDITAY